MDSFEKKTIDTSNRKYWFIRTDSGENFETFYDNNFVAIGWNELTLSMLRRLPEDKAKEFIEQQYIKPAALSKDPNVEYDSTASHIKAQVTGVLNKIKAFNELCKGDIVIIPSSGSYETAFGIIDDADTNEIIDDKCYYYKRRNVKWVKREYSHKLDAKFAYVRTPSHAISEINSEYHNLIDSTIFSSYIRDGFSNISLKIEKLEDIDYASLKNLIDSLIEIAQGYNNVHSIKESEKDLEKIFIKLNLQSPGFFNLKEAGKGLIFALAIFATACSEEVTRENFDQSKTKQLIEESGINIPADTIFKLKDSEDSLNVKFENIDSLLNN